MRRKQIFARVSRSGVKRGRGKEDTSVKRNLRRVALVRESTLRSYPSVANTRPGVSIALNLQRNVVGRSAARSLTPSRWKLQITRISITVPSTSERIVLVVKPGMRVNSKSLTRSLFLFVSRVRGKSPKPGWPISRPSPRVRWRESESGVTERAQRTPRIRESERTLGDEIVLFADAIKALGSARLDSPRLATPNRITKRWKNARNTRENLNNSAAPLMRAVFRVPTSIKEEEDRARLANVFVCREALERKRERESGEGRRAHGKSRLSTRAGFQAR